MEVIPEIVSLGRLKALNKLVSCDMAHKLYHELSVAPRSPQLVYSSYGIKRYAEAVSVADVRYYQALNAGLRIARMRLMLADRKSVV